MFGTKRRIEKLEAALHSLQVELQDATTYTTWEGWLRPHPRGYRLRDIVRLLVDHLQQKVEYESGIPPGPVLTPIVPPEVPPIPEKKRGRHEQRLHVARPCRTQSK